MTSPQNSFLSRIPQPQGLAMPRGIRQGGEGGFTGNGNAALGAPSGGVAFSRWEGRPGRALTRAHRGGARVWVQEMTLHPGGPGEPLMGSEQMRVVSRLGFGRDWSRGRCGGSARGHSRSLNEGNK